MATPLTALSKYTGVMMVVLCALLMFAFVIGDPLMQYAGGARPGAEFEQEMVATWRNGQINRRQLSEAVRHRNLLSTFQQAVFQTGSQDAQAAGVGDLPLRVQPLTLPTTYQEGVERNVVTTRIFAQRAVESGMVVSDAMVADYLRAIGRDRVSNEDMRGIIANLRVEGGRKATIAFLFDLLREAILARNYLRSHSYAAETVLPAERWSDWRKANERVVIEAASLATDAFLDAAPEPTDEELAAFYEEFRDRVPQPDVLPEYGNVRLPSAEPAFALPARVKLAVLKADFRVAVAKAAEGITDEEIAAFYQANRESFVQADRALFGDDDALEADDEPVSDDPADEAEAADEESPAGEDVAEQSATEESPGEGSSADEPSADESGSDGEATETTDLAGEEEEEEEQSTDSASESEADDTPYQPLEEVADAIRNQLAVQRAAGELDARMREIKSRLDAAYENYEDDLFAVESDEDRAAVTPPEELTDLQPLAEAEKLELLEVDQASQLELSETPLGRSQNSDTAAAALPVWLLAFRDAEIKDYEPLLTYDLEGNRYLILVADRYEGVQPELDEIRDEVVAAWKRSKAAELALERGEELGKRATATGGPLGDFLAGLEDAPIDPEAVERTEPFSLLTVGAAAPTAREVPLRLSQPEPLVAPGPELLESALALGDGDVRAALNNDHSVVYLMRIAQRIGTPAELRREFLRDGDRWFGQPVLMRDRVSRVFQALVLDLLDDADLVWAQEPDQI